jgi:hypothetical protein
MDATRFDDLIKRFATTRLTRVQTLRGLAAGGVAALTGVGLTAEEADAKKKNAKKVKVCQCFSELATSCSTKKKAKKKAKKLLRNFPCSYKGSCRGVSGCAAGTPGGGTGPGGSTGPGQTCSDGIKNGTETDVDCGGSTCPRCAIGKTCTSRNDCASARCAGGTCQTCTDPNTDCGTDTGGGMCACRESVAGPRICTKITCRFLMGGTCASCVAGEQCTVAGGGIECCLPCGA